MTPPRTRKGLVSEQIAEWRLANFAQWDATLKHFINTRDDPKASMRDRNEAGKNIVKMLGSAPERTSTTPTAPAPPTDQNDDGPPPPPMTAEQRAELDAYLLLYSGPKN